MRKWNDDLCHLMRPSRRRPYHVSDTGGGGRRRLAVALRGLDPETQSGFPSTQTVHATGLLRRQRNYLCSWEKQVAGLWALPGDSFSSSEMHERVTPQRFSLQTT